MCRSPKENGPPTQALDRCGRHCRFDQRAVVPQDSGTRSKRVTLDSVCTQTRSARPTFGRATIASEHNAKSLGEQMRDRSPSPRFAKQRSRAIDPAFVQKMQDATLATTNLSKTVRNRLPRRQARLLGSTQWAEGERRQTTAIRPPTTRLGPPETILNGAHNCPRGKQEILPAAPPQSRAHPSGSGHPS
jgi:hypothetical protein